MRTPRFITGTHRWLANAGLFRLLAALPICGLMPAFCVPPAGAAQVFLAMFGGEVNHVVLLATTPPGALVRNGGAALLRYGGAAGDLARSIHHALLRT